MRSCEGVYFIDTLIQSYHGTQPKGNYRRLSISMSIRPLLPIKT